MTAGVTFQMGMVAFRRLGGVLMLLLSIAPGTAQAQQAESDVVWHFPATGPVESRLRIYSSLHPNTYLAAIHDYQRIYPGTDIVYEGISSWEIYRRCLQNHHLPARPDMFLTNSMDLQTKLVNDGHALTHRSPQTDALPAWAKWRNQIFGISYEPVVIAYNTDLLPRGRVPRTRAQLLALLHAPDSPLEGRVGSYDIEQSHVGYLLATQDHQSGSIAGSLMAAFGNNQVHLERLTPPLLEQVADGRLVIAYGVFSSYVQADMDAGKPLGMVLPEDYVLMAARTAMIPLGAPNEKEAKRFLDYLLSPRGQEMLTKETRLLPAISEQWGSVNERFRHPNFRPIRLGPELLVYLDPLKRRHFLETWRSSVDKKADVPELP